MPSNCNDIRNDYRLNHGGTAQSERQPLAQQPDYVKVDEKTFADWIVFVRDYARFVQFYNNTDTPEGDWTDFWTANPAIILANLAAAPIDDFRTASRQLFIELQKLEYQDGSAASNLHLQQHLNQLFDLFTNLSWQLDRHIRLLPEGLPIKEVLRNRVNKYLSPALQKWIAWHKHAQATLLDDGQTTLSPALAGIRVLGANLLPTEDFYTTPAPETLFTDDWLPSGATDWATYLAGIAADDTVFGTDPTVATSVSFVVRHYFFTSVYEQFLQAFVLAIKEAEKALESLLYNWNKHEPHFALFLAFLRLLSKEQAYLNTLTDRHLRFYYERVLRLKFAPGKPPKAFLTVELAKQVDKHLLAAGVTFKAGKDATGQEIIFAATEDFVANKAKVTDLRSIFKAPNDIAAYSFGDPERPIYKSRDRNRYFASPVSNSADGLGEEELTSADGRWHPFGNKEVGDDATTWDIKMPTARIGFAIASNYLYLKQGSRTISLKFNGSGMNALADVKFKLSLTTEKGWLEKTITVDQDPEDGRYRLEWTIEGDDPAILPYQAKIHGGAFQTDFPMLKAELVHENNVPFPYQAIKNLKAASLSLKVDVTGKRDMALSGSTGPLDASKPFHPFGPAPGAGAVFILGDKEVFQKASVIGLRLTWKEKKSTSNYYQDTTSGVAASTQLSTLVSGAWSGTVDKNILPGTSTTAVELSEGNTNAIELGANSIIVPDFSNNQPYSNQATSGFLRFSLSGDWGHAKYPLALAAYAKGTGADPALPKSLYDPQLLDVELDYTATQEITLNNPAAYKDLTAEFFHLHPFGEAEKQPTAGPTALLPMLVSQYNTSTPDGPVNNVGKDGGEWLIGVEGLQAPQVLSLLIQVAAGTADPLLAKPKPHLRWWYLRQNEWVPFTEREISDGTQGLLQSGLVRLSIPADINEDNTLLPTGKAWLCATVETAVDAVNQIVGVYAQGMAVAMIDNQNDPQLGALPLPAGTIAKLRQAVGAVKKVAQPYATYGGSAEELPSAYYTRTSERLRHKDRAINMWDYERLLLQKFPQLHKVKCLNHLRYESGSPQPTYRELAPGHVTIVGIADLQNQGAVDPLRPYVSLADLEAMAAFLKKRMSCQATLHVRNPIFEPVVASFKVRLFDGLDETFYEELLNQEILNFLSPWATGSGAEIEFGGKMHKSVLVNFIEERPYVDYVEDLILNHTLDPLQRDVEMVRPTKQVAILVSARKHDIEIIEGTTDNEWTEDCGCQPQLTGTPNNIILDNRDA
ncbi:MAG: baseplate J/gp47 family protein [Lewinella sp.]|uniref:baseplate J/gp47 family protein n=1 Tax=Lewinella sp. TaxID=2004506 RepID=UPI003D6B1A9D